MKQAVQAPPGAPGRAAEAARPSHRHATTGFGAVVLSLHITGLGVVQHLARRGIPVVAMDDRTGQTGFSSRYGSKLVCPNPEREADRLLGVLVDLARRLPWRGVLFPANDEFTRFVSAYRDDLAPFFELQLPTHDVVEQLADKWRFHHLAARHGIEAPAAFCPSSEAEIAALDGKIAFPCVVKPVRTSMWKGSGAGKALMASSLEEVVEAWRRLSREPGDFLVQELIPGSEDRSYLYVAYYDRTGAPAVELTMRKIRQHPPIFGTACITETVREPAVVELSRTLLRGIDYRGIVDVEFKRDPRDGRLKIIEVNPRVGLQHKLATAAGADLLLAAYEDQTGAAVSGSRRDRTADRLKWIEVSREIESAYHHVRSGDLTLPAWLRSLRGPRTYATWDWRDPMPFLKTFHRSTVTSALGILALTLGVARTRPRSAPPATGRGGRA
jgi:predicted ATP-grasp superfamily ATP-dependent carboligase